MCIFSHRVLGKVPGCSESALLDTIPRFAITPYSLLYRMKAFAGKVTTWAVLPLILVFANGSLAVQTSLGQEAAPRYRVLVFSKTAGFRHSSIPTGIAAFKKLGDQHNFAVEATEDAAIFNPNDLSRFDAVVFLSTTGDILNAAQERAFEQYIAQGGGFLGVHAAADTEYEWPWYGQLVGGYFKSHPQNQNATIKVADRVHPATKHLPQEWTRFDEWYNYRENPRGNVHVLMTLDETSYEGGEMGHDHPISWAHNFGGGRAFYTGLGHTEESYSEPLFLQHLVGALEWVAGQVEADVAATQTGSFNKTVLVEDVTDPIELAVAPDNRVFFIERGGAVRVWHPETNTTSMVGFIPVHEVIEDGLLGITLDPNFEENGWMYLYYSPEGAESVNRLSRFTIVDNKLDWSSKKDMLDVPVQRIECCHTGGSLAFGPDGNLFLSTGDNTNPFASDGFAPIDDRPGREPWDARRTSANTNDLRGKILRIRPQPDGSYTIPEGNLFPDGKGGRPEIYTMGHRNPYRISIDPQTGWLYWGDVGPDAGAPNEERGPAGHDEFGQARGPGNYGWPLFVGDNKAYRDWDFETQTAGPPFDPNNPVNDSRFNTGARVLPPAQPAFIWYPYGFSEEFPEMEAGGRTAMAGPVYRYDRFEGRRHPNALPAYFDNTFLAYEWARNWIKEVKLDENGDILKINPLFTEMTFLRPMDMELGPDGRLYVIEWGPDFWGNGRPEQKIVRLDYYGSPYRPPVVAAEVQPAGAGSLDVRFSATAEDTTSQDASLTYAWDLDGDGQIDATAATGSYTYARPGQYMARLTVTSSTGLAAVREIPVTAGNTAPEVAITWPVHGGFFDYGQPIRYEVSVRDAESDAAQPERIEVQPYLGRDTHEMELQRKYGPEGSFVVYPDGYRYKTNQAVLLEASYRDDGANGAPALTGRQRIVLQPRLKQAEFATSAEGAQRRTLSNEREAGQAQTVLDVTNGAVVSYAPVNLLNIESLTFRVKPEAGGVIEVRHGTESGSLLAQVVVAPVDTTVAQPQESADAGDVTTHDEEMHRLNEGEQVPEGWTDLTVPVTDPGGATTLYLVFKGTGEGTLMSLDWIRFNGQGIVADAPQSAR